VRPNSVVRAGTQSVDHEPVPADQSVDGTPGTASVPLGAFGGMEVGVWEMTPGVIRDVENDEIFVVLSGAATVEFGDGTAPMLLGPGDVVRLAAGTQTLWKVTETLRKVYLCA
jgi:uncharacterized protein